MKFYLSSFCLGHSAGELKRLAEGRTLGFVPNAIDHVASETRAQSNAKSEADLRELGINFTELDLRRFFGDAGSLSRELERLGGVWVRGGNTFVLRQAMRLSGFDELLRDRAASDFLYGGYSAGVCVLAPRLDGLHHVDDPTVQAYPGCPVIWEGLGLLDYLVLPHYQSDHPESAAISQDVEYCLENGIAFRTLRDGQVIIDEFTPRQPGLAAPGAGTLGPLPHPSV